MNFYIVGHVVSDSVKTDALINKLNQLRAKQVIQSLWIVKYSGTVRDLEGELKTVIDLNDNLFVAAITQDCQYRNLLIPDAEIGAFLL